MIKIKVINFIVILPVIWLILWSIQSAFGYESQESDQESPKVSVSGPDDQEQILSLDPYSPPSIVNDVHDRISNQDSSVPSHGKDGKGGPKQRPLTNAAEFLQLFQRKRALQVQAVKGLISIPKYEKRFEMVTKIFSKIFQLQEESKSIIENRLVN